MLGGADSLPWIEKYRPLYLDDVVGNVDIVDRLKTVAKEGNMPNVILAGPPGIGKTSSILCLAREMLGDAYKEGVLELNASDERGVDVVREKIKMFAQKKVSLPVGKHKLIVLDEADYLTTGSQQALRRIMEIYSNTTRFALACNESHKLIEAIQSRCVMLRYGKLQDSDVLARCEHVVAAENIAATDDGLAAILFISDGDMRHAVNALQATYSGCGLVSEVNVFKVVDSPHPALLLELLADLQTNKRDQAFSRFQTLWDQGYALADILSVLFRVLTSPATKMPEDVKIYYLEMVAEAQVRAAAGVDSLLQADNLLLRMCGGAPKP